MGGLEGEGRMGSEPGGVEGSWEGRWGERDGEMGWCAGGGRRRGAVVSWRGDGWVFRCVVCLFSFALILFFYSLQDHLLRSFFFLFRFVHIP